MRSISLVGHAHATAARLGAPHASRATAARPVYVEEATRDLECALTLIMVRGPGNSHLTTTLLDNTQSAKSALQHGSGAYKSSMGLLPLRKPRVACCGGLPEWHSDATKRPRDACARLHAATWAFG